MSNYFNLLPLETLIIILSDLSVKKINIILNIIKDILVLNGLTEDNIYERIILHRYKDISHLFEDHSMIKMYNNIYQVNKLIKNNKMLKQLINISLIDKYKVVKGFIPVNGLTCTYIFTRGMKSGDVCGKVTYFYNYCRGCYIKINAIIQLEKERGIDRNILYMMKDIQFGRD